MIEKVIRTIKEYELVKKNDRILIGVSGGPDSIALLDVLNKITKDIEFNIYVAHINHLSRGIESDKDEIYVKEICEKLNIPFYSKRIDMKNYAKERKLCEEEAGREIRYSFFRDILKKLNGGKIAVAHNKNDQAETLFMRILRGTGVDGLKGMEFKNNDIIRPLLDITRDEIEDYLKSENINPRIDKTNLEPIYSRNKVRLELIPYIKENFNNGIIDTLCRTSKLMKIESDYLKSESRKLYELVLLERNTNKIKLDKEKFYKIHFAMKLRVLRLCIEKIIGNTKGLEEKHINKIIDILNKETGKSINISNNIIVTNSYNELIIEKNKVKNKNLDFNYKIDISKDNYIEELNSIIKCEVISNNLKIFNNNSFIKCFDYDKIKGDVHIRNRKNGDKFVPLGMGGSKKLKDFFIDEKISRELRDAIPIIHDNKNIIWIVGYRISELYKVDKNTKRILVLEYKSERSNI